MKIELNLNPDEALALIQICERDILFPEVSKLVIDKTEQARHEWANARRNDAQPDETLSIEGEVGFLRFKGQI